ncbi:MAG TPA: hypothetical protein VKR82_08690 [Candidatus Acidoferrales bacterium]|nr:hypothetical protein [Candidatus Acidoferrales bacterium]
MARGAVASNRRLYYNSLVSVASISRQSPAQSARQPARPRGFFRTLWRAIRQLFHETTGALFAILAVGAISSAVRAWENGTAKWIVALPLAYAMWMGYFSVTSFRSARRVQ